MNIRAEIRQLERYLKLAVYDRDQLAKVVWSFWKDTHPKKTKGKPEKLESLGRKYRDQIDKVPSGKKNLDDKQWKLLMSLMKKLEKTIKGPKMVEQGGDVRRMAYVLAARFGRGNVPQYQDIYGYEKFSKGDKIYFTSRVDGKVYSATVLNVHGSADGFSGGHPAGVSEFQAMFIRDGKEETNRVYPSMLVAPYNVKGKSKLDKGVSTIKRKEKVRAPIIEKVKEHLSSLGRMWGADRDYGDRLEVSSDGKSVTNDYRVYKFFESRAGVEDDDEPDFVGAKESHRDATSEMRDIKRYIKQIQVYPHEKAWFSVQVNLK